MLLKRHGCWNLAASKSPENCRFLIVATATAVLGIALMGFPSPSLFPQRNPKKPRPPRRGFFFSTLVCSPLYVRCWHLADIGFDAENVRFRGESGHS